MPKSKFELGQARSWSKYGGSRKGFNASRDKGDWTCQVCAKDQSSELPKYFIPFDGELMVMCASCKNKSLRFNKFTYFSLKTVVRLKTFNS